MELVEVDSAASLAPHQLDRWMAVPSDDDTLAVAGGCAAVGHWS